MNGVITDSQKPQVVFWYTVYCFIMALLYLMVIALGLVFLFVDLDLDDAYAMPLVGGIYLAMGIVLFIPFVIAPFFPNKSWHWIYGLVIICLGMTSCCSLPATIPLLIYWLKPETKHYFGRFENAQMPPEPAA